MNLECRKGFTLIEVLVALSLTALVALMAHRLLVVTIGASRALHEVRDAMDRTRLGQRWLRLSLASLETGGPSDGSFDGRPEHLGYSSWLRVAEGWHERRRVTLRVAGGEWRAETGEGDIVVLQDSVARVEYDYLLDPGADTRWVRTWQSPLSAPLGVRCRVTRSIGGVIEVDTMLYLIRDRG